LDMFGNGIARLVFSLETRCQGLGKSQK
jgi:hypothetical protein